MSTFTTDSSGRWYASYNMGASGTTTKTFTISTNNKLSTRDIKIDINVGTLCNLSGQNLSNKNAVVTTTGWYFPPNSTSSGSRNGLTFDITLGKQNTSILLSTANKLINGDITVKGTVSSTGLGNLNTNFDKIVYLYNTYAIVNAQSAVDFDSLSQDTWWRFNNSGDINIYAYRGGNSTSTINVYSYGYFLWSIVGSISRYGTGSPGSPYSYGGSTYAKITYKKTQSTSSESTTTSTSISGQSGYNSQSNRGLKAWKWSSGGIPAMLYHY